jgi:hypothetical protein
MRRGPRICVVPTLAAFATVALVIAACACAGGSGDSGRSAGSATPASTPVAQSALIRALEATRAVQSGRVEVTTTITDLDDEPDPPRGGRLTVATYRVAFDRRAARFEVEADLSTAELAAGGDPRAGDVAGREGLVARMIAAGGMVYAQGGPMAGAVGRAPGDWVAIERGAFQDRRPSGDAATLLLDPLGPFGMLAGTTGDARVVGHDVIRGSPVTHMATHADSGGSTAQVDAWVDADGVIRRMEIGLTGAADAAGATKATGAGSGRVVTTVELFDIGRAVAITPPGEER